MLTLPEQLMLLSADERGRPQFSVANLFNAALVGAALLELLWEEAITVTPERVTVAQRGKLPSEVLNVVAAIVAHHEPLPAADWTRLSRSPLPNMRDLVREHAADQLFTWQPCRKLFIFPSTVLVPDAGYRERMLHETRGVLLGPEAPDNLELWALGALVDVSGLIYRLYREYAELHAARERADLLGQRLMGPASDEGTSLIMQGVYAARRAETEGGLAMS